MVKSIDQKRKIGNPAIAQKDKTTTETSAAKESANETEAEEDELTRKAKEALLSDIQRSKIRADSMGPQGWKKQKKSDINKRFLLRTVLPTLGRPKKLERKSSTEPRPSDPNSAQKFLQR